MTVLYVPGSARGIDGRARRVCAHPRRTRLLVQEQLKRFQGLLPVSQGQNMALTVLYVPYDCLVCDT